ncbi:unnamed protein product [Didymodactylos carnosus]|uniref:Uncharacterized protein n=1 Tax=Didymodactylos carnosus TaxID=1234261 RepID=A0A8S2H462_9BILA|nr:unnamed protein product [Didymodactylos carnosus]CAF3597864.1 unnamed protein product [Didymodactylos carnosus]
MNSKVRSTSVNKTKQQKVDDLQSSSSSSSRRPRATVSSVALNNVPTVVSVVAVTPSPTATHPSSFSANQNLNSSKQPNAVTTTVKARIRWKKFKEFHFKNFGKIDKDLILFRMLSIIGLLCYTIIDTIMYSSTSVDKSEVLQFFHGSRYVALEIFTTVYASGVPAFGVSVEIYLLIPYVIVTSILVARKCGSKATTTIAIVWVLKIVFIFIAVEMNHWNFRKYRDYKEKFNTSARALQRQALIFSYDTSHCGIVELYEPLFSYDNDKCLDDLTAYVTAREQLRVLRNFMFGNGVSYAVFNCNVLDIEHRSEFRYLRCFLILVYVGLATSVLVGYVDPLYFIKKCRLAYNIVELAIFIILFLLPAMNLYRLKKSLKEGEMEAHPDILPRP